MRTKSQIKIDRLLSSCIGTFGSIGVGFYIAKENIIFALLCFCAMLFLLRVDKCNNDLEYGRHIKEKGDA